MQDGDKINDETVDPDGRRIVLLQRIWIEKILRIHPEMHAFQADVLRAVAVPDHLERDSRPGRTRSFSKCAGPTDWLLVVVSYEQQPARIITAYGYRKDPQLWKP
ncbi:MAG: hypothetical protein WBQ21_09000 [Solirubrobacteraceae bacterium]